MIMVVSIFRDFPLQSNKFPWEFTVTFSVLFMLLALVISFRENKKWTLYLPVNKKVIHRNSAT